jgi:O-antigen biosynthesis protein
MRGWRGTLLRARQEFESRPQIDTDLSLLSLDELFAPFALPVSDTPMVSIVIPVHGKLAYTLACLRSIARYPTSATIEVIVVDDASPDDSVATLTQIDGLRVQRNEKNLGFIGSCNAGVLAARGEFLLFLNNDTQVTSGWLDALLKCFAERSDCGIAGSKLVYPDGRLQEAGGLVFSDGSCWTVGRFESRDAPGFLYRREVDYVSGASLLVRREVFDAAGGFDALYTPAYYEDVDLAFAVRKLGLKVYYEPTSTVIHCEGISSGTDLGSGVKQHQVVNQTRFAEKWGRGLAAQPVVGTPLTRAVGWRARGHVLIVDAMTPDTTRDSGSLRLNAILRLLDEQGWSTSFFPDDGRADRREVTTLGALGCEVLHPPWIADLPTWLREHGRELHAVMLCRHSVAGQYVDLVRRHAPQATLIFDTVDLHFLREQRAAELSGNAALARQAAHSQRSELALIERSDITFVVSAHEQALIAQMLPAARVELLSNIHEIHGSEQGHAARCDLVFIGGYGHPPNSDAIRWIAEEILPQLRAALSDLRVHVLGDMPESVQREFAMPGLELHGRVADLAPWMNSCLASLAPLRFGAGVKGKINMAMSYGLPVIATPVAVEGMQLNNGMDVMVAEKSADFVSAVLQLQKSEEVWQRLSTHGLENVRRHFSVATADAVLRRVLN